MSRPKKNKTLQIEKNPEEPMTKLQDTLDQIVEHKKNNETENQEVVLEGISTEIDMGRQELEKLKNEIAERREALKKLNSREYDAKENAIAEKQLTQGNKTLAMKQKLEQQKAFDRVSVTGKFINKRAPGQPVKLPYIKYADDPVKWWPFEDGKIYTIPRGFADQINDHYFTPRFTQKQGPMNPDEAGSQIHDVDMTNKKYAFVPVGF